LGENVAKFEYIRTCHIAVNLTEIENPKLSHPKNIVA
jgi:hypothetical protein